MNSTTEETHELHYAAIYGCILTLGLPLNAVSLWILLRHHSLKSPSVVFMVNLATSDLLLVISLPMRVYFYATGTWPLGSVACKVASMLFLGNIRSSSIFITLISVDRLLAVVYPLRSRGFRTSCNAWKSTVFAWFLVLVISITERIIFARLSNDDNVPSCFKVTESSLKHPIIYYQPVLVCTMMSVNVLCTIMVFWTLHKHVSGSARVRNNVNVMLLFVLSLIMFIVCFLPVSLGLVTLSPPHVKPLICLAAVNCCVDPLLYYFSLDGFWKKKEHLDPVGEQ